ncbi:MAG: hypothetical protein UGE23_09035 [Peptococcaceae bacterium]|nr:hypothetical protein [Peptococcaceae bacterium]
MTRKMIVLAALLLALLAVAGCSGEEEDGPTFTFEMAEARMLTSERQRVMVVPVKEDCKAMLQYTYTTDGQAGAVLWLENGERELLMHELAATTDENYENIWEVGEITLLAGENVFSLSAPEGGNVSCRMTIQIDELDPDNFVLEEIDPNVQVKES